MDTNVLYYGDNLEILRKYIPSGSIDLIYLDPPFDSQRDYNIVFRDASGRKSTAQIQAFDDTWSWGQQAEATYAYLTETASNGGSVPDSLTGLIRGLRDGLHETDMLAYVVEMSVRLNELHRVLSDRGSIYLHCDPSASHYLKLVMDAIFGPQQFQNEVVWYYRRGGVAKSRWGRRHDILLFYTKGKEWTFNADPVRTPYSADSAQRLKYKAKSFRAGRVYDSYEPNPGGKHPDDVWELQPVMPSARERLGWPTQKPLALLERVILASSSPGDVILDPFCGCGTTLVAAEKLGRQWIGIDITYLAVSVMRARLIDSFGLKDIRVLGEPTEIEGVRELARTSAGRYQFEWWAVGKIGGQPLSGNRRKGADSGIDGAITFVDAGGRLERALIQVKSGHFSLSHVRDLKGTVAREKAAIGIVVTLDEPTAAMRREATVSGFYHSDLWGRDYPRIQILTASQLLAGQRPALPPQPIRPYRPAPSEITPEGDQQKLF